LAPSSPGVAISRCHAVWPDVVAFQCQPATRHHKFADVSAICRRNYATVNCILMGSIRHSDINRFPGFHLPAYRTETGSYQKATVIVTLVLYCLVSEILQVFCSETDPLSYSNFQLHPNFGGCSRWTISPMSGSI